MNASYARMSDIECPVAKSDSICYWKDMWQKLDRMRKLWQLCDVSIITDNKVFKAHSPVLAASSNIFHELLIRQSPRVNDEMKLYLRNVSSDVIEVTLDFIYGITPQNRQGFERLQMGAAEFGISGAFEYCAQRLKKMTEEILEANLENNNSVFVGQGENLTCYQKQLNLTPSTNGSGSGKCDSVMENMYSCQSLQGNGETDCQETSSNGGPSWLVNGIDSCSGGRAEETFHGPVPLLASSSAASDLPGEMPSDEIHTALFTQMSLVDLTAGVKCPHIKGIMGEDNPMDSSFLGDDDLVDDAVKARSPGVESDFDDGQTAEENKVELSMPMPPKKRKRMPDVDEAESDGHSRLSLRTGLARDSNVSDTHNAHSNNSDPKTSFSSSDFSNTTGSLFNEFPSKCSDVANDEPSILHELQVPTNLTALVSLASDSSKVRHQNTSCEMLPSCGSFLYPCVTANANSELDLVGQSLLPKSFSFNAKDSSYSLTCALSDVMLATSYSSVPYVTSTVTSISSYQPLQSQQVVDTSWKDPALWNMYNQKPGISTQNDMLTSASRSSWVTISNMEPYDSHSPSRSSGLMPESVTSLSSTDVSCKPKGFTSPESATAASKRSPDGTSITDIGCPVPVESSESLGFSFLGPSQGTVPSSLIRSQPSEICPPVADISVPASSCMDEGSKVFHGSSFVKNLEPEEGSNLSRQNMYQCSLCNKCFKTASQLNGHKKRTHPQQDLVSSSSSSKLTIVHKCQYCEETFKSSYKLQTHQLKVHSKGKLFSCQDCSFRSPKKKKVPTATLR